jgi:hypothetical protein
MDCRASERHTRNAESGPRSLLSILSAVTVSWFVWISDSGSVSVTDDARRIPAKHRAEAREITPPALACGRRFTLIGHEGAASKCSSQDEQDVAQ